MELSAFLKLATRSFHDTAMCGEVGFLLLQKPQLPAAKHEKRMWKKAFQLGYHAAGKLCTVSSSTR